LINKEIGLYNTTNKRKDRKETYFDIEEHIFIFNLEDNNKKDED